MNAYVNIINSEDEVICKLTLPLGEKGAKISLEGPDVDDIKEHLKRGIVCRDPESGKTVKMSLDDGSKLMASLFTGLSGSRMRATKCYFDDEPLTEDREEGYDKEELQKAIVASVSGTPVGIQNPTVGMLQLHWQLGMPVHADFRLSVSEGAKITGDRLAGNVEWPVQWVIVPKAADTILHINDSTPMFSFEKPTEDAASESKEAQEFVGSREVSKDSLLMERAPNPIIAPFMPGGSQETPDIRWKMDEHLAERKCKRGNKACKNCGNCPFSKAIKKDNKVVWLNDEALRLVALFKWEPGEQTEDRREYVIHDCTIPELNGKYAFERMDEFLWKFTRV